MAKKDKDRTKERGKLEAQAMDLRLQRLEAALARLEAPHPLADGPSAWAEPIPDAPAAAAAPEPAPAAGIRLTLGGGPEAWRFEAPAATVAAADWPARAARLAALGHPVRLAILRAALDGPAGATALKAAAGVATPGQLYHHLRELTAAGWLRAQGRGVYALPPGRAGALLAVLAAAGAEP